MIALDTNILIYFHREDSQWHQAAKKCVVELSESKISWAIPWPCIHEFFSIVTHPRIYSPPTSPKLALEAIEGWLESPTLTVLTESESYWPKLREMIQSAHVQGPKIHDAHIAALCVDNAVSELWTADRDFSRFRGLKVRNPLI